MRTIFLLFALISSSLVWTQSKGEIIRELEAYRAAENEMFKDPARTPLTKEGLATFKMLDYYPIDLGYRVKAKIVRTPGEEPFLLRTNTDRLPEYVKFGEAHFSLYNRDLVLNLYRSTESEDGSGMSNTLFVPFTDLTSGDGSYGGGRYLEFPIPAGDTMIIDFNMAFNPYCVYNENYSCPITPRENDLFVRIEAGMKDFKGSGK
ncbi:DUF1684 domain-containing protein [Pukyongia salina]|nr:DUF1684 domain-containing protein [Pukyongia salina]